MNQKDARRALAMAALGLFPPALRQLAADAAFRKRHHISLDATITVGPSIVSFKRSTFFEAIRKAHAKRGERRSLSDIAGARWAVGIVEKKDGEHVSLAKGEQIILLPDFFALDSSQSRRLARFSVAAKTYNLPEARVKTWRAVLRRRRLTDEEVGDLDTDLLYTPVRLSESILEDLETGSSKLATLVPPSTDYYERLIGPLPSSIPVEAFAETEVRQHIARLVAWDPVEGARLALLLSGHPSIMRAIDDATLRRIDLLRLAEWARDKGDPLSQLGMVELGIRLMRSHLALEPVLAAILRQLLGDNLEEGGGPFDLLSSCFVLAEGELSRLKIMAGEPPFRRRLASLAQASLLCRLVTGKVDTARFAKWAWEQRSYAFFCQTLVDLRLEPRWMPDLASAEMLHSEFMGRLAGLPEVHEPDFPDGPVRELLLGAGDGALSQRVSISSFWPGPLEGARSENARSLPDEFAEMVREGLASPTLEPKSFFALVNSRAFELDAEYVDLAISSLKGAKYRLCDDDDDVLESTYRGLAAVAASERRPDLADALRILIRRGRRDLGQKIAPLSELRIALTAAAAHAELEPWRAFFGDWALELAYGELTAQDGDQLLTELDQLIRAEPALATHLDRPRAALSAFVKM